MFIDWSVDQAIDWLILFCKINIRERKCNELVKYEGLIVWSIDRLVGWSVDWLSDLLIDYLIDWF